MIFKAYSEEIKMNLLLDIVRTVSNSLIVPAFTTVPQSNVSYKLDLNDFVTDTDRAAESAITKALLEPFPNANIIGEEAFSDAESLNQIADSKLCFIIDPLDGTWNFANAIPLFGVILAVTSYGETKAGIIHDPITNTTLVGLQNEGAFIITPTGKKTRLQLNNARTNNFTGFASLEKFSEYTVQKLLRHDTFSKVNDFVCSAWHYRILATNGCHFNLNSGDLMPWDHAAGTLICKEAGGYSALIDETPYSPAIRKGKLLSACSKDIWEQIANEITSTEL